MNFWEFLRDVYQSTFGKILLCIILVVVISILIVLMNIGSGVLDWFMVLYHAKGVP